MKHKIAYKHHTDKKLSWLISNQVERNPDTPVIINTKYKYKYKRDVILPSENTERIGALILETIVIAQMARINYELCRHISNTISNSIQI